MADRLYMKGEALKFGWEKVKANILFFLGIAATVVFVNALPRISDALWGPSVILGAVFFLLMTFINIGMTRISLNFVDGSQSVYADLFSGIPLFLKYLGATSVYMVVVFVGLVLLIAPGIWLSVRLMFFGGFVVDKGLDPIESLKRSFQVTSGRFWDLLLFVIIMLCVNALGIICLGVGLLITLPLTSLALFHIYRKLEPKA